MHNKLPKNLRRPVLCALTASIAAMSSPGYAQLEEVVVTAQKREQNLQEIGVSVTAIGGDTLDTMNVVNTSQIAQLTPNLTISTDQPTQSFPAIRGIGSAVRAPGVDQGVAIYLDGAQIDSGGANLFSTVNLAQVEILKGPQGTLYGRNAIGGVINLTSAKPSDEFAGSATIGFGNFNSTELALSVEGGLTDTLSARISGSLKENDETFKNTVANVSGAGAIENSTVRAQFVFKPSERIEASLALDYSDLETDGPQWKLVPASTGLLRPISNGAAVAAGLNPAGPIAFPIFEETNTDPHAISHNLDGVGIARIHGGALNLSFEVSDTIEVVSVTAHRTSLQRSIQDLDASPRQFLEVASQNEFESLTQETRLHYSSDDLTGVVGSFYSDTTFNNIFHLDQFAEALAAAGGAEPSINTRDSETEASAIFTQWDWSLSDALTVTAGVRYGKSTKLVSAATTNFTEIAFLGSFGVNGRCFAAQPGLAVADQPACLTTDPTGFLPAGSQVTTAAQASSRRSFSNVSPKLGLSYQLTEDTLVFGSYTEGYRDGGISGSVDRFAEFDEEILNAYEVGFKTELADSTIRLNGSVFYYDYENLQIELTEINGAAINTNVFNAGDAKLSGAEFELQWAPNDTFFLTANLGLIDSEFANLDDRGGTLDLGGLADGNEFPAAPSVSASLIPEFNFEAMGGNVNARLEINYSDEYFEDGENGAFATADDADILNGVNFASTFAAAGAGPVAQGGLIDNEVTPSHVLVNSAVTYTNDSIQLSFWVRNLLEEEYEEQRRYINNFGLTQSRFSAPRTFGVRATFKL